MTEVEDLVLEHLKRFQSQMNRFEDHLTTVQADVRALKQHVGALVMSDAARDGDIASLKLRLERIERRLDLVE